MSDNEKIAKFMGFESFDKKGTTYWRIISDKWDHLATESKYLAFDSKWDDLMPVVEKISQLHKGKFKYDPIEMAKGNFPEDHEYLEVIALPLSTPIEEVYKAVLKFIDCYETQKV